MLPLAPVLWRQGRHLRRVTPILPEAGGPWSGAIAGPDPLRLLVLGDSTASGVGVDTQQDGLPGQLARALHARGGRGIEWTAIGRSGATSRDIIEQYLPTAPADLLFLSIGANDALGLRTTAAFAKDVRAILTHVRSLNPATTILMSSLPVFHRFELLPQPLKRTLYRHSIALETAARHVVDGFDDAHMSADPPPYSEGFFATDLFHPSAIGYRDWVDFAVDDAVRAGLLR